MTDLLSQEEIDALLRSAGSADGAEPPPPPPPPPPEPKAATPSASAPTAAPPAAPPSSPPPGDGGTVLSAEAIEQLSEVAKLSLGATSSVVQMLLNRPVELTPNPLRVINYKTLAAESGGEDYIIAKIAYAEGFDGNSYLMLRKSISSIIGDLMMGGEGKNPDFQEMHKSAVGEMMNQMMGKTTTTLSEIFKKRVDIAPPQVELVNLGTAIPPLPDFNENAMFLRMGFGLKISDIAESEVLQLLPIKFAQAMAADLAKPQKAPVKAAPPPPPPPPGTPGTGPSMPQQPQGQMQGQMPGQMQGQMPGMMPGMGGMQGMMPGMMPGMGGMQGMMPGMGGMPGMMQGMGGMSVQGNPAEFGMLQMPGGMGLHSNIDLLLDVPLQITVELGRTRMLIKDVLELGIGSVVELNKLAGEAVEVYVNNKLIAKGEVVVIDENFAVRITSIINPQDRLQAI